MTNRIRVVCAGDSITRGRLSTDYVAMLRRSKVGERAEFVRHGVNGDLAYNLLQRLDRVVAAQPDVVTVLIGTNDVRAAISAEAARRAVRRKNLPVHPTLDTYRDDLDMIVSRLRAETRADIALLSLPVLGQDLRGAPARAAAEYSVVIRTTAAAHGVGYLPVNERQTEYLACRESDPKVDFDSGMGLVYRSLVRHFLLGASYRRIGASRGLILTTDHVHQNPRGVSLIADAIEEHVDMVAPLRPR
ncbi:GDSL-type esterase/lipase family protein [Mycobacterium sp. DL440]|uniref:SGNH/GDSL hydrolase family protein n=1 Tax=Mycobacterium sp. DL440 TaxID=2675523 RepID=UPI001421858C|nr:GDSL-type esterase/lipase family protein [Mycobacterium sp. DL440]